MQIRNITLLTCVLACTVLPASMLWAQIKVTVSPANQPVDSTSAATMKAFSVLNSSLADAVDPSASACVKSYAVYQTCKAGDSPTTCGQAPTCSVTSKVPLMSGVQFIFPPGVDVASLVPHGVTMDGNQEVKIVKGDALPPASGAMSATGQGLIFEGKGPSSAITRPPLITRSDAKRVSGGVMQGLRTNFVQPAYPPAAKAAKMSGVVVMTAVIGKDGSVKSLEIASCTNPVFNKAAMDAVSQWKYKPYMLNGEPAEVMTTITVNFAISPSPPTAPNGSMSPPDEHIPNLPH